MLTAFCAFESSCADGIHLGPILAGYHTHKLQFGSGKYFSRYLFICPLLPVPTSLSLVSWAHFDFFDSQVNFCVGASGLTQLVRIAK
jgi:hypothetical protein